MDDYHATSNPAYAQAVNRILYFGKPKVGEFNPKMEVRSIPAMA